MVNQSDLPFRLLVRRYNTSLAYTQMLLPERLLNDQEYLDFHLRELGGPEDRPVVVQLSGNDPETVVRAARKVQTNCDAIGVFRCLSHTDPVGCERRRSPTDLNVGCPQEAARDAHYGAYLLGQKDWPLVEGIGAFTACSVFVTCFNHTVVSAMSSSLTVPVSVKLRLCQPASATVHLAQRLEHAGASWITLHARTVSARRRRQGAADLEQVRLLKEALSVPVVSNGNVNTWEDVEQNLAYTGADGIMVGETLLSNPW